MTSFPEPDIDETPPTPPSALGLVNIVLLLLITAVGGLGLMALMTQYFADQELVQASHPYSQSKVLLLSYPEVSAHVGENATASDTGQSSVHWNFPNAGSADIHFRIDGDTRTAFANLLWSRIGGRWQLLSASWTDSKGQKKDIPLGPNGRFMTEAEILAYDKADPLTPLGRGQRALLGGRYPAALQEFGKILAQDPENVEALTGRGAALFYSGELELATRDFEAVLNLDPTHIEANRLLGQMAADDGTGDDIPVEDINP